VCRYYAKLFAVALLAVAFIYLFTFCPRRHVGYYRRTGPGRAGRNVRVILECLVVAGLACPDKGMASSLGLIMSESSDGGSRKSFIDITPSPAKPGSAREDGAESGKRKRRMKVRHTRNEITT
jgi:hypothetical protein